MSGIEIKYALDFRAIGPGQGKNRAKSQSSADGVADSSIPRIARLMALAIRFEGLLREEKFRDYAELARTGRVTRARMTQIMKLLHLAPDIQERLLFLPPNLKSINERNLRSIVQQIDWDKQRLLFHKITTASRAAQPPRRT